MDDAVERNDGQRLPYDHALEAAHFILREQGLHLKWGPAMQKEVDQAVAKWREGYRNRWMPGLHDRLLLQYTRADMHGRTDIMLFLGKILDKHKLLEGEPWW